MSKLILETERLLLREFEPSDAEAMFLLNSDPEVIKHTGDPPFESIEEAQDFISNYTDYKTHGYGRWSVIKKSDNTYVGWCGLKYNELQLTDIGFRFFQNEWGRGYATESALAVLRYGFETLRLKRIIARASSENIASISVIKKLGMRYWKTDECKGIENSVYYIATSIP